jgi:hypothetical protein
VRRAREVCNSAETALPEAARHLAETEREQTREQKTYQDGDDALQKAIIAAQKTEKICSDYEALWVQAERLPAEILSLVRMSPFFSRTRNP